MKSTPTQSIVRAAVLLSVWTISVNAMAQGGGNNDAMLLLLEQNRSLQSEVQALRALVEEQGFEIRKLQRESLDRYTDTDNRLRSLEQMLATGAASGTGLTAAPPAAMPTENPGASAGVNPVTGNGAAASTPAAPGALTSRRPVFTPGGGNASTAAGQAGNPVSSRSVTRPGLEPSVLTEQQLYQMAYDSAINSQFERAIAEFDQYLGLHPQGRFTTNAHYWKGQSYLYLNRYEEAIAEYGIILQQYPEDAKAPDSMYGQAVAYENIGENQRAAQLLRQIMRLYPNTGVANLADTRLRSLN